MNSPTSSEQRDQRWPAISFAPPPLDATATRGFGPLLEQEYALHLSIRDNLLFVAGPHATAIRRTLEEQRARIDGGIALLEQRVETLPYPNRFHALARPDSNPSEGMPAPRRTGLAELATQHLDLQDAILALIDHRGSGSRPERLLTAVARGHEEMAWLINALLSDDDTVRDREIIPIIAEAIPGTSESTWENEGGRTRAAPVTSRRRTAA